MYKFRSLLTVLALTGVTFLSSCGSDDTEDVKPAPALALTGPQAAGGAIAGGDPITINITATNNGGSNIDRFEVRYTAPGTTQALTLPDETVTGINQPNFNKTFNATAASAGGVESYTFIVTNKDGRSTTEVVSFTATNPNQGQPIKTFTTVLVGAQSNANYGSFLDAHTGTVYKQLQANQTANQGLIDMIYFHGATNLATLAAPNDASFGAGSGQINIGPHGWGIRNATEFRKLGTGSSAYSDATDGTDLENAFVNATVASSTRANELAAGSVVAFKTADGKYGVARVQSITGASPSGYMTIDVKMQN